MLPNYTLHLNVAINAAQTAGSLLRDEFHRPGGPRGSGGHAEVDECSEALIRQQLIQAFPDYGILGEEKGFHPGDELGDHLWLIDPNDGTSSYLKGFRGSAVSIALLKNGIPVLGVVYAFGAPNDAGDMIAWAEGCGPIQRNGKPCPPRSRWATALDRHHTIFTSQQSDDNSAANASLVAPGRFRALPSIAYRLALVAAGDGEAAVSLNGPIGWDYAAGHALLLGVGGTLLDSHGASITYSKEGQSSCHGRCFGGNPTIAALLAKKNWGAVYQKSPRSNDPNGLVWPIRGRTIKDTTLLSRAQGCLLGQLSGDALGQMVEFKSKTMIAGLYPDGLHLMDDGGSWDTIAGQPTDDSELALLLARDLVKHSRFDTESVARAYAYWITSKPFDIGNTTRMALAPAAKALAHGGIVAAVAKNAANTASQANGALMRVSPMGIFGHAANPEQLAQWAREDAQLTHPHPVCQDASAVFVVAIQHALTTGASPTEVYQFACKWAIDNKLHPDILTTMYDAELQPPAYGGETLGWVRVALQNAFWQLLHAASLEAGVVNTVMQGGDTDTNGTIAGALLGAMHGLESIPQQWLDRVLTCRPIKELPGVKRPRPVCFWPVDALVLAEQLLNGNR